MSLVSNLHTKSGRWAFEVGNDSIFR